VTVSRSESKEAPWGKVAQEWCGSPVPGFRVLSVNDTEIDVVIEIETDLDRVGCPQCGVIAKSKDRRWVTLRGAPAGERPVTLRWWKRVLQCAESACGTKTWTEQRPEFVLPRHSLTERVGRWATDRVAQIEATPTTLARQLGVTWPTVWAAIVRHGQARLDTLEDSTSGQVRFDETVMSPSKHHRARRFITAAVDVVDGRIIDIFEGRNAAGRNPGLQAWLGAQPVDWVRQIRGLPRLSIPPLGGHLV
jgi:transposase